MRTWAYSFVLLLVPGFSALAEEPRIASTLQPFVDEHQLAGAVTLVATPQEIRSLQAVGYADIGKKKPMKTDALFWIASMNKPLTASCLMMLVDEGKIALDDPVEKYLPEFRDQMVVAERSNDRLVLKKPEHPITVREILSHTSGLVQAVAPGRKARHPAPEDCDHHLWAFALAVRAGDSVPVLQRRHQHGGKAGGGDLGNALRAVPARAVCSTPWA